MVSLPMSILLPMQKYLSGIKIFSAFIFSITMTMQKYTLIKITVGATPFKTLYLAILSVTEILLVVLLAWCAVKWRGMVNNYMLIILTVLQYPIIITLAYGSSSVVLLAFQLVLFILLDWYIFRRAHRKKWDITFDTASQIKMVYMKRSIVNQNKVDLSMGEIVELISNEGEFVIVRKFNGEEFTVNGNDVVEDVEDLVS